MVVKKGNKVKVDYVGSFEDGTEFDSSVKHGKPLEFVAGEGMVVPGFDSAVMGMEVGEEKTVTVAPNQAYGQVNPQAIQKVPADKFPKEAQVGMMIGVPLPNGQQAPAKIVEITPQEVTIDLNHPLAGKTLVFRIKIVEILD
jgi:peptidylprolyl isomerase